MSSTKALKERFQHVVNEKLLRNDLDPNDADGLYRELENLIANQDERNEGLFHELCSMRTSSSESIVSALCSHAQSLRSAIRKEFMSQRNHGVDPDSIKAKKVKFIMVLNPLHFSISLLSLLCSQTIAVREVVASHSASEMLKTLNTFMLASKMLHNMKTDECSTQINSSTKVLVHSNCVLSCMNLLQNLVTKASCTWSFCRDLINNGVGDFCSVALDQLSHDKDEQHQADLMILSCNVIRDLVCRIGAEIDTTSLQRLRYRSNLLNVMFDKLMQKDLYNRIPEAEVLSSVFDTIFFCVAAFFQQCKELVVYGTQPPHDLKSTAREIFSNMKGVASGRSLVGKILQRHDMRMYSENATLKVILLSFEFAETLLKGNRMWNDPKYNLLTKGEDGRLYDDFNMDVAEMCRVHLQKTMKNEEEKRASVASRGPCCTVCRRSAGESSTEGKIVLRACSRCKVPRYCSRECQSKHWKFGHKKQCKAAIASNPM